MPKLSRYLLLFVLLSPVLAYGQTTHDRINARGQVLTDRFLNRAILPLGLSPTPSVSNGNLFKTGNIAPLTITNFTGGLDTQEITVICGDTFTSIANNANIGLSAATNFTCTSTSQSISLIYDAAAVRWVQKGGSGGGGGVPAGVVGAVQFQDSGIFGGSSMVFTRDKPSCFAGGVNCDDFAITPSPGSNVCLESTEPADLTVSFGNSFKFCTLPANAGVASRGGATLFINGNAHSPSPLAAPLTVLSSALGTNTTTFGMESIVADDPLDVGTGQKYFAFYAEPTINRASGSIAEMTSFIATTPYNVLTGSTPGAETVGTLTGLHVKDQLAKGTLTAGVLIDNQTAGAGVWGLKVGTGAPSEFGSPVAFDACVKDASGSCGTSGQVYSSTVTGTSWVAAGSGGAVTSVFGRVGAVVSANNDYTFGQLAAGANSNAGTFSMSGNTLDLSAATKVKQRVAAGASTTVNGDIAYDTTNKNWHAWANAVDNFQLLLPASITPANNDCAKFTVSSGTITLNTLGAACPTVTSVSIGNLSPLFTASVSTATTTPAISFALTTAAAHKFFMNNTAGTAAPGFQTPTAADLPAIPLTTGVSGILPVANGGSGTATPSLICGTNCSSIAGTWPNQTINVANTAGTAFSSLTASTVAGQALVVGAGSSLDVTGGGTINATSLTSVIGSGPAPTVGQYPIATSGTTFSWQSSPALSGDATTGVGSSVVTVAKVNGNSILHRGFIPAAGCVNSVAVAWWNTSITAVCKTGTNVVEGALPFADTNAAQLPAIWLPPDWTGAVDVQVLFSDASTSGTVIFSIATACSVVNGSASDDVAFNATQALGTITLGGTANGQWAATKTGITTTGCSAGQPLQLKLTRATDSAAGVANVKGLMLTLRGTNAL